MNKTDIKFIHIFLNQYFLSLIHIFIKLQIIILIIKYLIQFNFKIKILTLTYLRTFMLNFTLNLNGSEISSTVNNLRKVICRNT